MEPGAPTRQSDHDPTHEQNDDDQNYKAVVQGHTRHLYEKSGPAPSTVALHPANPPIVSEEPDGARLSLDPQMSCVHERRVKKESAS